MRVVLVVVCFLLNSLFAYAEEAKSDKGAEGFVREVVLSLIDGGGKMTFEVAGKVFAIDNGEVLSKDDLKKAWPEIAKTAFTKKVTADEFWRSVKVEISSPMDNKHRILGEKVLDVYQYQKGDLYCNVSSAKEGVDTSIAYDKAFIYVIRKVEGKWTLIGIGG